MKPTIEEISNAADDYAHNKREVMCFKAGAAFVLNQQKPIKKGDRIKCTSANSISLTHGRYYTALCDEYDIGNGRIWVDILDDSGARDSEPISVFEK